MKKVPFEKSIKQKKHAKKWRKTNPLLFRENAYYGKYKDCTVPALDLSQFVK